MLQDLIVTLFKISGTADNQSGINIKVKLFNLGIIEFMELLVVNVIANSAQHDHYNRH